MSPAFRSTRPRVVADDSDSGTEVGHEPRQVPTEAEREEIMRKIAMEDLSSAVRDNITSVVSHGPKYMSIQKVHASRDCNQPGTEAARIANQHRSQLNGWSNFKYTPEAKDAAGEELQDFCGGQFHRLRTHEDLEILKAKLGTQLTLDNVDDRRGRNARPSHMVSRGGSHAVADDRGHLSATRGGGFAGRGSGRVATASNNSRLLDPDRVCKYNDKGCRTLASSSRTGSSKAVAAIVTKTVKVTASDTTRSQGTQGTGGQSESGSPSNTPAIPNTRQSRPTVPTLAGPSDFMAAVKNTMSSRSKPTAAQAISSTSTVQQPAKARPGLSDSKYATPAVGSAADEKPAPIQRLSRAEFRDPDLSPDQLTDALASTGKLSIPSPSLTSDNTIDESKVGIGLGIQIDECAKLASTVTNGYNGASTRGSADIMDIVVPDVNDIVLVPSPKATSPGEDKVTISKAEAEQWNAIKRLIKAGDPANLVKYLHMDSSTKPIESAAHKGNVTKVNRYGIDNKNLEPIVGDKRNLPKGVSTQTNPSLHDSVWALNPKAARFTQNEPVSRPVAAPVHFSKGERAVSLVNIQSTSSSSYSGDVEYVKTIPLVQKGNPSECGSSVVKEPFEPFSSIRTDPCACGELNATVTLTSIPEIDVTLAASQASFESGQFFFGKQTKNPFAPREPAADNEDIVLDYSEPVALRVSSGQVTETKPRPSAGTNEKLRVRAARLENAGYVRAGNSGIKGAKEKKATHGQGRKSVASLQQGQAAQNAEAVMKPAPKKARASTTSAAKPCPSRGGLATSRWAPGSAQAPNPALTLRERSPNKDSKGEIDSESGRMAGVGQKVAAKPEEPIFGDSRNVSRLGAAATSLGTSVTSSFYPTRLGRSLFPKPIKREAAGSGFAQLLRDLCPGEASKQEEPKQTGEGRQATTQPSSFAQQFGVNYDSDESEL